MQSNKEQINVILSGSNENVQSYFYNIDDNVSLQQMVNDFQSQEGRQIYFQKMFNRIHFKNIGLYDKEAQVIYTGLEKKTLNQIANGRVKIEFEIQTHQSLKYMNQLFFQELEESAKLTNQNFYSGQLQSTTVSGSNCIQQFQSQQNIPRNHQINNSDRINQSGLSPLEKYNNQNSYSQPLYTFLSDQKSVNFHNRLEFISPNQQLPFIQQQQQIYSNQEFSGLLSSQKIHVSGEFEKLQHSLQLLQINNNLGNSQNNSPALNYGQQTFFTYTQGVQNILKRAQQSSYIQNDDEDLYIPNELNFQQQQHFAVQEDAKEDDEEEYQPPQIDNQIYLKSNESSYSPPEEIYLPFQIEFSDNESNSINAGFILINEETNEVEQITIPNCSLTSRLCDLQEEITESYAQEKHVNIWKMTFLFSETILNDQQTMMSLEQFGYSQISNFCVTIRIKVVADELLLTLNINYRGQPSDRYLRIQTLSNVLFQELIDDLRDVFEIGEDQQLRICRQQTQIIDQSYFSLNHDTLNVTIEANENNEIFEDM